MKKTKITQPQQSEPTDTNTYTIAPNDFFDWEVGLDFENRLESAEYLFEELSKNLHSYKLEAEITATLKKFSPQVFFNPNFWPVAMANKSKFSGDIWNKMFKVAAEILSGKDLIDSYLANPHYKKWLDNNLSSGVNTYLEIPLFYDTIFKSKKNQNLFQSLYVGKLSENNIHRPNSYRYYGSYPSKNTTEEKPVAYKNYDLSFEDAVQQAIKNKNYEHLGLSEEKYIENIELFKSLITSIPALKDLFYFDKNQTVDNLFDKTIDKSYMLSMLESSNSYSTNQKFISPGSKEVPSIAQEDLLCVLIPGEYIEKNKEEIIKKLLFTSLKNSHYYYQNLFNYNILSRVENPEQIFSVITQALYDKLEVKKQEKRKMNEVLYKDTPLSELSTEFTWTEQEKRALNAFFRDYEVVFGKDLTPENYETLKKLALKDKEYFKAITAHIKTTNFFNSFVNHKDVLKMIKVLGHESASYLETSHYEVLTETDMKAVIQQQLHYGYGLNLDKYPDSMLHKSLWKNLEFTYPQKDGKPPVSMCERYYGDIAKQTGLFRDAEFAARMLTENNRSAVAKCLEYKVIRQKEDFMLDVIKSHPEIALDNMREFSDNKLLAQKDFVLAAAKITPDIFRKVHDSLWRDIEFVAKSIEIVQSAPNGNFLVFPRYVADIASTMKTTGWSFEEVLKSFEDTKEEPKKPTLR